ncbi:MAG TPA: ACT domain-containing protein, partial [Paludibacteraceae bacterium]|nr:ACT domain-containing protein [Paludibacteraceae bacterium]
MKTKNDTAILLIYCPDKPGILASVTEFINRQQGNIIYLDQYVNREEKVFFMRIEWDISHFQIPKSKIE